MRADFDDASFCVVISVVKPAVSGFGGSEAIGCALRSQNFVRVIVNIITKISAGVIYQECAKYTESYN